MTDSICVLEEAPASGRAASRRLTSNSQLARALAGSTRRQVWVLRSREAIAGLIRAMSKARPGVRGAHVISYTRPEPVAAHVIESGFDRALLGAQAMPEFEELAEILRTAHPEDYCIGAEWDAANRTLALWRGDLTVLVVPDSEFSARRGVAPDPSRLSIEDSGQTLRMGEYEASVDAILFDRDPLYRRRAKKRMLKEERGIGASIRRLRLARGVQRSEFPGLDEKTVARIERGEVERPQRATLQTIAKRLGVTVEELAAS
jgi:hypothetical protein